MADLLEAASAPRIEDVAGTPRTFADLTIYDRAALMSADRAARKRTLVENLKLAELPKDDVFQTLQGFDRARPTDEDWIAYVNSVDGKLAILPASLEKTYPGEGAKIARAITWPPSQVLAVAAHVCGLTVGTGEPAPAKKEDTSTFGDGGEGPNPQRPPTFQPETAKTEAA